MGRDGVRNTRSEAGYTFEASLVAWREQISRFPVVERRRYVQVEVDASWTSALGTSVLPETF